MLHIKLTSIIVNDQDKALKFYTEVLGFVKKKEFPAGEFKWITVASADGTDVELSLEPNDNPAAKVFQKALFDGKIPITSFYTNDVQKESERLSKKGVVFHTPPTRTEWGICAVFEDTCGNLLQIHQSQ